MSIESFERRLAKASNKAELTELLFNIQEKKKETQKSLIDLGEPPSAKLEENIPGIGLFDGRARLHLQLQSQQLDEVLEETKIKLQSIA